MVKRIVGSYTNVVGLPLCEVIEALKEVKAVKIFTAENAESAEKI
jgi:predicted house-cleaning NTP pyrophosphatase (Maf/HAM1 superfamily)